MNNDGAKLMIRQASGSTAPVNQGKPRSARRHSRRLFILAGPSGSGKTMLLRSAAKSRALIFGDDYSDLSYATSLGKLIRSDLRLAGSQPFEVTGGGVLSLWELIPMAKLGLSPSLITFLHIDLSFPLKLGHSYPKDEFWHSSVGVSDPSRPESFDVNAFRKFWSYILSDSFKSTDFAFSCFDQIVVNTIAASRKSIVASKSLRDTHKLHDTRWNHAFCSLYSDSDKARRIFKAHQLGWNEWLKSFSLLNNVRLLTTDSIHAEKKFVVHSNDRVLEVPAVSA